MRGERRKLWRNGLLILGLVGLGISGGTLAALISGASAFDFHGASAPGQGRVMQGHRSGHGATGTPVFAQFHWGLPEEDPTEWLHRLSASSTGAGLEALDQLRFGRASESEDGISGEAMQGARSFITSEAVASQLASVLMRALFPNGRLVSSNLLMPPPSLETPTGPDHPPINQPVSGLGDPPTPFAEAAEPGILALLAVAALGVCWLRRSRSVIQSCRCR